MLKVLRERFENGRGAAGGVVGPAAFIGAWTVAGLATSVSYSMVDDPISRLAAVGAPTRLLMTSGFFVFGIGLAEFAGALRLAVKGPAWIGALGTGVATLLVAAAPLDESEFVDQLHGVFAGSGYLALAATPLLAARPLIASGHRALGASGVVAGATSAVALVLSLTDLPTGLWQRVGLTVSDLWIVAAALLIVRGRLGSHRAG